MSISWHDTIPTDLSSGLTLSLPIAPDTGAGLAWCTIVLAPRGRDMTFSVAVREADRYGLVHDRITNHGAYSRIDAAAALCTAAGWVLLSLGERLVVRDFDALVLLLLHRVRPSRAVIAELETAGVLTAHLKARALASAPHFEAVA